MTKTLSWRLKAAALALPLCLLAACKETSTPTQAPSVKVQRPIDMVQVARGKALYEQNCIRCHGHNAQGDPQWRQRNPDGTFPPPPLDGTGHAWHHSHDWLHEVILTGTEPQGHMPAWGGKLNDQQVDDVIAWFQSLWPDEVYAAWWEMEQRSRTAH